MMHDSSGKSRLFLGHALMACVFCTLRVNPAARRVVCSRKYRNRLFSWGMSGCAVLLVVLADPDAAVKYANFGMHEAAEMATALAALTMLQQKFVEYGIFIKVNGSSILQLYDSDGSDSQYGLALWRVLRTLGQRSAAPTAAGLVYCLLTSGLMRGEINPLHIDADCAFGLLKLLQALLAMHNTLSAVDRALGRTLVGLETVRCQSQRACDALRAIFEPFRADPSLVSHLVFAIDVDHILGSSLTERITPIVIFSGVFSWSFISKANNHAAVKASAFGQFLYSQLIDRALHLNRVCEVPQCWDMVLKMLCSLAGGLTSTAFGLPMSAVVARGARWCVPAGRSTDEHRMRSFGGENERTNTAMHLLIVVLLLLLSHVTPVWPCGASSRDGETNQLRVGGATQSISPWSWWSRSAAGAQAPLEHRSRPRTAWRIRK